jgi:hypothetical protein
MLGLGCTTVEMSCATEYAPKTCIQMLQAGQQYDSKSLPQKQCGFAGCCERAGSCACKPYAWNKSEKRCCCGARRVDSNGYLVSRALCRFEVASINEVAPPQVQDACSESGGCLNVHLAQAVFCKCGVMQSQNAKIMNGQTENRVSCDCAHLDNRDPKAQKDQDMVCRKLYEGVTLPTGQVSVYPCCQPVSLTLNVECDWVAGIDTADVDSTTASAKTILSRYGIDAHFRKDTAGSPIPHCKSTWLHCQQHCQGNCPNNCPNDCRSNSIPTGPPGKNYSPELLGLLSETKGDLGSEMHVMFAKASYLSCDCAPCQCSPQCPSGSTCSKYDPGNLLGLAVAKDSGVYMTVPPDNPKQCGVYIFMDGFGSGQGKTALSERGRVLAHELLHMLGCRHCANPACIMYTHDSGVQTATDYVLHCMHMRNGFLGYMRNEGTSAHPKWMRVLGCAPPGTQGEIWFPGHDLSPMNADIDTH